MIPTDIIKKKIEENPNFCYLTKIANVHLSEYVDKIDNIVEPLTNFTGDTAYLYIDRFGYALLIDGRFTIQAKKETKNIEVVLINEISELYDYINDRLNKIYDEKKHISTDYIKKDYDYYKITQNEIKLCLDDRLFSCHFIEKLNSALDYDFKGIIFDNEITNEIIEYNKQRYKDYYIRQSKRKLFVLDNNKKSISKIIEDCPNVYITFNLEEIASITNLRLRPSKINDSLLFKSFLIILDGTMYLYTDYELENKNTNKYLIIKNYSQYYDDLKSINNSKETDELFSHYLKSQLTVKSKQEIASFKRINEQDAIAMIKFIYALKHFDFDKNTLTEYSLKKIVDILRSYQKGFLSTSFDTIVAYKENSAICHYSPKFNNSKVIRNNGVLLIDSGGNYIGGTTDITRVVSLYKDKNKIPKDIKHYYTLVLKSLLSLSNQKFPDGYRGAQLDIIARQYLFNECLDYGHGTGHGIGNNTSVHYGNNTFSSRVKNDESNVLKENQVQSCEPGIYFENKYGIRLENDTYTKKIDKTDYLYFETLNLCPFDYDLIEFDELDKLDIERLNAYNHKVYSTMKRYFKADILNWLRDNTLQV